MDEVNTSSSQSTFDSYYFSKVFDRLKCQVSEMLDDIQKELEE